MQKLIEHADRIFHQQNKLKIEYYQNTNMKMVTIRSEYISDAIAKKHHLVPNDFKNTKRLEIVTIRRVENQIIDEFSLDLHNK